MESGQREKGTVAGVPVSSISLDTECSQTIVKSDLIFTGRIIRAKMHAWACCEYSLALIEVVVEGRRLKLKTGVAWKLHMNVPLGTCARTYGACVYKCSNGEVPGDDQGTDSEVTH